MPYIKHRALMPAAIALVSATLAVSASSAPAQAATAIATPAMAKTTPEWQLAKVAIPGEAALHSITASGRDDAWAIGRHGGKGAPPLALHWNGRTWRSAPVPGLSNINNIDADSPNDVWAVGTDGTAHWDGRRWKTVRFPVPANTSAEGMGIKAVSIKDAWLIGSQINSVTNRYNGFVQHWNGRQWRPVQIPAAENDVYSAIDARGPRDVWIAAYERHGKKTWVEVFLHWNGNAWKTLPAPASTYSSIYLTKIRIFASNDVWGVGRLDPSDLYDRPLAMHWDGRRWSYAPTPNSFGSLYDVVKSGGRLWAVGDTVYRPWLPLALRWSGRSWTAAPAPIVQQGGLFGAAMIPGGGIWAVGYTLDRGDVAHVIIARHE